MTERRRKDRSWKLVLASALGVSALALPLSAHAQLPNPPSLPSPPSINPHPTNPVGSIPTPPVNLPSPPPVNTPSPPPVSTPSPPPVNNPTPNPSPPATTPPPPSVNLPSVTPPSVSTPPPPDVGSAVGNAGSVVGNTVSTAGNVAGSAGSTVGGTGSDVTTSTTGALSSTTTSATHTAKKTIRDIAGSSSGRSSDPLGTVTGALGGAGGGSGGPVPIPIPIGGGGKTRGLPGGGLIGGVKGGSLNITAATPRSVLAPAGTAALLIADNVKPRTVSPVYTDPLGRTLFGGPASGDSLVAAFGAPVGGFAVVAAGADPGLGVLGINPVAGVPLAYGATVAAGGTMTPAGLISTVTGVPGAPGGGSGGSSDRNVIQQVGHAIDTVIAHLPDWSRPIIAGLLLLALFFGIQAWRNARRARKTLLQNEVMQSALVPALPDHVADLDVSGGYRAADEVAQGGDFYDVFALDEHRTGIILGDVSGHDMKALNRSNEVRHKLRTLLEAGYDEHWEVRRVLAKASTALSKQWLDGDFVTAAVAIHDASTGTLTYACAGHPAPVLTGVAHHEPVSACSSPALGWGLPTGRRQTTVILGEHETACFFTDGLIEARIKGSFLGRDGLEDLVRDLGETGTAKDLLRSVIARAHEAEDDLAALVLRPTASVPSDTLRVEELEFSANDVRRKVPERFLAACDAPAEEIERLGAAARAATTDGRVAVLRVSFSANGHVEATVVSSGAPDPQTLVAA